MPTLLLRRFVIWTMPILFGVTLSSGVMAASNYPSLEMHGWTYANACSKPAQQVLRQAISKVKVEDLPAVWRAVQALLCAPRTGPERVYLASMFAKKVKKELESTGSKPSYEVVPRTDELINDTMAAGEAWATDIQIQVDEIKLHYFANEACVRGVTFSYRGRKWVIDEIGEACD